PLFAESRAKAFFSPADESLAEQLAALDPEEVQALLKKVVAEEVASILRLFGEAIDLLRPLSEIGMDSLMAVELRLALENRLRIDLLLVFFTEGTSVASIAARLAAALSTGLRDGEVIALTSHHETLEEAQSSLSSDRVAAE